VCIWNAGEQSEQTVTNCDVPTMTDWRKDLQPPKALKDTETEEQFDADERSAALRAIFEAH
jgi:hypothetical protein